MESYAHAKRVFMELFLANKETDSNVNLTQKDVEGVLRVFNWRRNKEINYEEFKLLSMEWNKTCKLLTSGNFFLNITHYQELFHERWFFSILRDMYGTSELEEETAFIYESRSEQFLEKLKETPFLGYDFVQKAIYSVEENQIKQMQYYYRGLVPKKSLFLFFVIHRQTNTQKGIELSQVKAKLHLNQFEHIEQEFKAFFKDNNLCRRELLSKRECFNFIIKLINSQIISHESLTKAAISFYGMLKKSNAYSIPSILRNQVGNLLSRKFSAYLTTDETDSLILFTKADVWLTVAKLKEKQQFIDMTQKNEDHIIDSMLGSFLSFKKSLSVLRGTPQTSQHQSTLKEIMKGVYAVVWEQDRSLNKLLCEFYDLGRGQALEGEEENSQDATIYSLLRDYRDPDLPEKKTPVSRSGKQHSQNDLSKQEWNKRETTDGTTLGVESQTQGERRASNRSRGNSQVDHCSKAEQSYAAREKKQEIKMKASASRLNFEEELSKLFPQESRSSLSPIPKAVQPVSTTPNRTPNHREIKESDNYVRVYNKNQMEMNPLKTSNFGKVEASYSKISPSPKLKVIKNSVLASIGRSGKENRAPSKSSKNSARKPKDFSCQCYKGKSINKVYKQKVLQDISNLDVESSIDKSSVDLYVPKTKRKIKDEYSVASKVDNRREKSQKRTSQAKSILEKQYKCAKIESFDSVISSLKGEIQRNAYNEYKKGFIN